MIRAVHEDEIKKIIADINLIIDVLDMEHSRLFKKMFKEIHSMSKDDWNDFNEIGGKLIAYFDTLDKLKGLLPDGKKDQIQ